MHTPTTAAEQAKAKPPSPPASGTAEQKRRPSWMDSDPDYRPPPRPKRSSRTTGSQAASVGVTQSEDFDAWAVANGMVRLPDPPRSLFPPLPQASAFPIDCMGGKLSSAAADIAQ